MRECNPILEITFIGIGTDTFSDRNSLSYSWDFGEEYVADYRQVTDYHNIKKERNFGTIETTDANGLLEVVKFVKSACEV